MRRHRNLTVTLKVGLVPLVLVLAGGCDILSGSPGSSPVDEDGDGFPHPIDCDDKDAKIHPDAVEICDGLDNDCDGVVDPPGIPFAEQWFVDADGDGYGAAGGTWTCGEPPSGANYVTTGGDCDDADGDVHPDADEVCDEVDNDCDGQVDDVPSDAEGATEYFADLDEDGFGDPEKKVIRCAVAPAGYTANATDCDDTRASIKPGASEIPGNGVDEDCDGFDMCYVDADADGFGTAVLQTSEATGEATPCAAAAVASTLGDCDDEDDTVHPDADEVVGDGLDQDCDGFDACYADFDGDGFGGIDEVVVNDLLLLEFSGGSSCVATGLSSTADDCDDLDPAVNPDAPEVCDNIDNDCDGTTDNGTAVGTVGDGLACPAASCTAIAEAHGAAVANGEFHLVFGSSLTYRAYCFQDENGDGFGPGWTMLFSNAGGLAASGISTASLATTGSLLGTEVAVPHLSPGGTVGASRAWGAMLGFWEEKGVQLLKLVSWTDSDNAVGDGESYALRLELGNDLAPADLFAPVAGATSTTLCVPLASPVTVYFNGEEVGVTQHRVVQTDGGGHLVRVGFPTASDAAATDCGGASLLAMSAVSDLPESLHEVDPWSWDSALSHLFYNIRATDHGAVEGGWARWGGVDELESTHGEVFSLLVRVWP